MDPGIVLTIDGRNNKLFLVFPFFHGLFLAVPVIFFFLFLAFLTREQVFSRGYRRSARRKLFAAHFATRRLRGQVHGRRPADQASKRAPRPQPSRTRFPRACRQSIMRSCRIAGIWKT
jgi:hypothetical protein